MWSRTSALAKVATSARGGQGVGLLPRTDGVSFETRVPARPLWETKHRALGLATAGYPRRPGARNLPAERFKCDARMMINKRPSRSVKVCERARTRRKNAMKLANYCAVGVSAITQLQSPMDEMLDLER